ncbi:hypothetical protein MLD38_037364 [Melastoma candidum]|uniref:Uncharacterized protein n=1 Tax=Melastoma candidum TaxID=119954 RepID=A0ACB9LPD3_9MYRT|nr:hypothetical protein MLD38_037364 [Melastoma candidum]
MATPSVSSFCLVILLCSAAAKALEGGLSVELIHRDSPKSPFYDPSETPFQRAEKAVRRSIARVRGLRSNDEGEPSADISRIDGEYLVNITIGTPPVSIMAIADTGSDLIWTQCQPCDACFPQVAPLFNPKASSTYEQVHCVSDKCHLYDKVFCNREGFTCHYSAVYGDQSHSEGVISTDVIGLSTLAASPEPVPFPGMAFGCGIKNDGLFSIHATGIVGLSAGKASLVSQMGGYLSKLFAYCLVPFFSTSKYTSKLTFGSDAQLVGDGVVITPLILKSPRQYYYLTLEGISVNGKKFVVSGSSGPGAVTGNMVIDSGTTLTWLPSNLYGQIVQAVSAAISLPRAKDPIAGYGLCYESSGELKGAPSITVHFTGADVVLNWYNAFFEVKEGITCFSFAPTDDIPIYGNLAQMNFWVSHDLTLNALLFKPADCAD